MSTVTSKFFQKNFQSKIALQLSAFADSHRAIILASHILFTKSNEIHPIPLFSLPHPAELQIRRGKRSE
ncbi:MAG: hypothetical protein IJH64_08580 [Oscillospiraceae bacterium]|nr:hypothetical protein [Oscillospiraceae bacterium]